MLPLNHVNHQPTMMNCVSSIYHNQNNDQNLLNILKIIPQIPHIPEVDKNIDAIVSLSKIVTNYPEDLEFVKEALIFAAMAVIGGHAQPMMGVVQHHNQPAGNAVPRQLNFTESSGSEDMEIDNGF